MSVESPPRTASRCFEGSARSGSPSRHHLSDTLNGWCTPLPLLLPRLWIKQSEGSPRPHAHGACVHTEYTCIFACACSPKAGAEHGGEKKIPILARSNNPSWVRRTCEVFRASEQKALAQPLRNLSPHATFGCDPIGMTDLARLPSQSTGGSLEALHVHVPCRLLQTPSSVPF